jgi:hypothetical protein
MHVYVYILFHSRTAQYKYDMKVGVLEYERDLKALRKKRHLRRLQTISHMQDKQRKGE